MPVKQTFDDGDDALKGALRSRVASYSQRLETLESDIADLLEQRDSVRERLQRAVSMYEIEFGESLADQLLESSNARQLELESPTNGTGPLSGLPWMEAMHRVLREAEQPLHVKDIWARLVAGGFRTEARDPLRSIAAVGLRDPALSRVRPNTYALTQTELTDS